MYLLDTNAWIVHLRSKGLSPLSQKLLSVPLSQITTCSVMRAELILGALKGKKSLPTVAEIRSVLQHVQSFSFSDYAADIYAGIRADLESKGLTIGGNDYLIAAISIANKQTLVTHNTAEFSRIPNLQLEDWQ